MTNMKKLSFNEFCHQHCDGLYDPNFPEYAQCTGYLQLKKMVKEKLTPASREEVIRWENNPTQEELISIPDIKYLRFLHPVLRPYIIENWEMIKNLNTDSMNQEVKTKWVAALRSGEYKQGQGALKHGDTYCCLGVLCDIHAKETGNEWKDNMPFTDADNNRTMEYHYLGAIGVPPNIVMDWAGLDNENKTINTSKRSLTMLNDKLRYSFEQIADVIEKEL